MTSAGSATPPSHVDVAVIGAGAGGLTVAFGLARAGKRVALIERGPVGGDCTNVGCIPSKTLLVEARRFAARGITIDDPRWPDLVAEVLRTVRTRRDALRDHEEHLLTIEPRLSLIVGRASLVGRGELVVAPSEDRSVASSSHAVDRPLTIRARKIVVATGARPAWTDIPGLPRERTHTNEDLFDLTHPPRHLVVVGAGAIGVEMTTAFALLGVRVTVVEAGPRILPAVSHDAAEVVAARLRARGVDFHTGARTVAFDDDRSVLTIQVGDDATQVDVPDVDRVLLALGRRPNVEGLGLEQAGVQVGPSGIVTDARHATTVPGIDAIGDVTGRARFTHAANAQGRRVVRRTLLPWLPLIAEGAYPAATFSIPEVATIGPSLDALTRIHPAGSIVTHRVDLADVDRGYVDGTRDGFVEVHASALGGRVLAATVVGDGASEIVNLLVWWQRRGVSLWQGSRHVVAYPAASEAIKKVADAFVFAALGSIRTRIASYVRQRPSVWGTWISSRFGARGRGYDRAR